MPISRQSIDPMQKAIPRNPRYEDVGPTVDTGASLSRYMKKMEEFRENFRVQNDEIFKRMKLSTFVQLVLQIHEERGKRQTIETFDRVPNGYHSEPQNSGDATHQDAPLTARSTLEKLVRGVGEFDNRLFSQQSEQDRPTSAGEHLQLADNELPYLLLDLRDREEFDACHIITAQHYPIAMLSRSINFESLEMLAFRNKPGRIVILYDEDERMGPRAAATLVQRGYSNVYLLSGGLKLAWKRFPEGLIVGEMPRSIQLVLCSKPRARSTGTSLVGSRVSSAGSNMHNRSIIPSPPVAKINRTKASVMYCEPGSRDTPVGAEEFLYEDIVKLTLSLERGMDDGRSIRSGYAQSTVSSARHTACTSATQRKPFR